MNDELLHQINQEIYAKFPYMSGVQSAQKKLSDGNLQLTYSTTVKAASGFEMPMIAKVKVTPAGKILGITTSK